MKIDRDVTLKLLGLFVALVVGAFVAALVGCRTPDMPPATMDTVVGNYKGSYLGVTEYFELRADGTFMQTLYAGKDKYANEGSWRIEKRPGYYDYVTFSGFSTPFGWGPGPKLVLPPTKTPDMPGLWLGSRSGKSIVFNVDSGHAIHKQEVTRTAVAR